MDEVDVVHLLHAQDDVAEELLGLRLAEGAVAVDEVPEVAIGRVLHRKEHSLPVDDDLVQADDVRVMESLHGRALSDNLLVDHPVAPVPRAEALHRHVDTSPEVVGQFHGRELPVSQRWPH